ncbi:MAG: DUF2062 domain-containing protein [Gemmatimonadetes bacterium]|nr:DUF2062 domain-containing protein [Gemmatimonadota bacterium]
MSDSEAAATLLAPAHSVWTRRVVTPLVNQLRQGITPEKISLTIALGLVLGVFPILGATTILCGLAAVRLGLNQPIIQLVNYVAYPLQLLALIPFYRAGETLFRQPHLPLSIPMLIERFRADTGKFFADFGLVAVQGIAVWCLVAPIIAGAVYFSVRPALRALARATAPGES